MYVRDYVCLPPQGVCVSTIVCVFKCVRLCLPTPQDDGLLSGKLGIAGGAAVLTSMIGTASVDLSPLLKNGVVDRTFDVCDVNHKRVGAIAVRVRLPVTL